MTTDKSYLDIYRSSLDDPEAFWMQQADSIDWTVRPSRANGAGNHGLRSWFPDGELNTCFNAVDRHVEAGRKDQPALIYDSAMLGAQKSYSYGELQNEVARTAGMIAGLGVGKGDRVIIYMPMIPQAVFAMLACARLGAVHSVVFGGFAAKELATRIDDAEPKVLLTATGGIEPSGPVQYLPLISRAVDMAQHKPAHVVVLDRPEISRPQISLATHDWADLLAQAEPADCVACKSSDPLYILYTSGTTGVPKGVVRDNGGHAVALNWTMKNIYGVTAGDVYWAASDIGWVVGHSYIVYAPLIAGCTTILYEGKPVGTPAADAFWRVISDHKVDVMFTAPTAIRAIKREDPAGDLVDNHDISSLRCLFLAGERADPDTLQWAGNLLEVPIIDHWWQTELGWPALTAFPGLGDNATREGAAGRPAPGYEFAILDEASQPLPAGETGDISIKLPLPPGNFIGLWNNEDGLVSSYLAAHSGYYVTGDSGTADEDGFVTIQGRIDDIINVAGHRLSTGGMEAVVANHADVAECAVIGVSDALKGQLPMAFVVLKQNATAGDGAVQGEVIRMVRDAIGPVAALKRVVEVPQLPKTRSGKVLRRTLRELVENGTAAIPPTIEDPAAVESVQKAINIEAAG